MKAPATYVELLLLMDEHWYEFEYLVEHDWFSYTWLPKNVHIYNECERIAKELKERYERDFYGIWLIANRLRWESFVRENDTDYKISNNPLAYVSRLIMFRNPELMGMFKIKRKPI